jgi:hypothetical protein
MSATRSIAPPRQAAGTSGGTPKQKVLVEDCGVCDASALAAAMAGDSDQQVTLNAVVLANYVIECMNMPNGPTKINRYMDCFNQGSMRVCDLRQPSKQLYSSVDAFRDRWCEIFDASAGDKAR